MEIIEELNKIWSDVLDEDVELTRETTADDVDGWDSLAHVQLIVMIEKKFKINFSVSEVNSLKKIGDLVDLIKQKI